MHFESITEIWSEMFTLEIDRKSCNVAFTLYNKEVAKPTAGMKHQCGSMNHEHTQEPLMDSWQGGLLK